MAFRVRSRIKAALKKGAKTRKSMDLLGCTWEEYMTHLGNTVAGSEKLHIDHIWPVRCYDLTDTAEQQRCFNYRNTRLLTSTENLKKSGNVPSIPEAATVPFELWPKRWKELGGKEYENV